MEHITLNNGLTMPILGLGCYQLHGKAGERAILDATELGYRLFDTAQMYGNEKEVGHALRQSGVPREELFVTTKIYSPNTSYAKAKASIVASLRALQMEYVDLLLIHEPYPTSPEMYRAMEETYREGKVRAIGVSNFNEGFYRNFLRSCQIVPAVNQVEAHILYQQEALHRCLQGHGTVMQAWSPFAAGRHGVLENHCLREIGSRYGKSAAQITLRFLTQRGIAAIPKSSHRERLKENMDIFDFQLSQEDMSRLAALDEGRTLFGWY